MKKLFLFSMMCLAALTMQAQRCAVLEFHAGVGISQNDVDGISAIFITYFRPSGYTMVERTQIDKVLQEQGFQHSRLTEAQMVRIGQILNVSKIVVGDINVVQGQYNVDTRAIDVESGTIVATEGSTFASSSYRTSMQNVAQKLAAKIAVAPNTNPTQEKPVTDFVDLDLPSGTLWKGINQSGFYTQDDAKRIFKESLPTAEQWEELKAVCIWTWTGKGYKITGSNGTSITLPAMGNPSDYGAIEGKDGYYWSSSDHYGYDQFLHFNSKNMEIIPNKGESDRKFSIRLVKNQ